MTSQKTVVLFWVLTQLSILLTLPANAVHPVNNAPENITIDPTNSSIPEIEERLGRNLNWREKIGLRIYQKKARKAAKKHKKKLQRDNQGKGCVTIILKNGDRMEVSIIRITETEVIYKTCGDRNSPEVILSKEAVGLIQAENRTEIYRAPGFTPPKSSRKLEGFGVAATISTGLGVIIAITSGSFAFLALVVIGFFLGIISAIRFLANKGRFKGLILAFLGMSAVLLFFALLAIYGYA